ncbi:Uncharacterised protein [Burkholderia pseudomallei]|nr:Uncharacterised protein [Burkholderia pseudomallei]
MSRAAESGAERCTAPITSASYGSARARGGACVTAATASRHAFARACARAVHAASARQPSRRAPSASSASRASACTIVARCLSASNAFALMPMTRARANSVFEPVVKSCSRVPTAITQSASCASAFAAGEPVTPIAPAFSGWSHGSALLPACVSPTGMPWRSANAASAAAPPSLYSAPPPATMNGRADARSGASAASSSASTGAGAWNVTARGAKNSAG